MAATIEFTPVCAHKPGTIGSILARSYEPLIAEGRLLRILPSPKWPAFDSEVFENLDTVGRCVFVTCVEGQVVGFASWDARWGPACGVIGHNCVLPEYRGRGYGRAQILEILRRFRAWGFQRALVTTGDDPFFLPAQRMYQACGFLQVARFHGGPDHTCGTVRYEMDLAVASPSCELQGQELVL